MSGWHDTAACLNQPHNLFFPDDYKRGADTAKAICRSCPAREECLNFALAMHIPDGVFGGLTPAERQALRGVVVWRDCVWCGQRFAHPDRLIVTCGSDCRDEYRAWQKRQSRQRRRSVA